MPNMSIFVVILQIKLSGAKLLAISVYECCWFFPRLSGSDTSVTTSSTSCSWAARMTSFPASSRPWWRHTSRTSTPWCPITGITTATGQWATRFIWYSQMAILRVWYRLISALMSTEVTHITRHLPFAFSLIKNWIILSPIE